MINESKTMILITVFVITLSLLSGCAKSEPIVPKPTVQVPTDPDPVKQRLLNAVFKVANIRDYEGLSVSVYWMHPEVIREFSYKLDDLIKKAR